jgi:hypothetical protein
VKIQFSFLRTHEGDRSRSRGMNMSTQRSCQVPALVFAGSAAPGPRWRMPAIETKSESMFLLWTLCPGARRSPGPHRSKPVARARGFCPASDSPGPLVVMPLVVMPLELRSPHDEGRMKVLMSEVARLVRADLRAGRSSHPAARRSLARCPVAPTHAKVRGGLDRPRAKHRRARGSSPAGPRAAPGGGSNGHWRPGPFGRRLPSLVAGPDCDRFVVAHQQLGHEEETFSDCAFNGSSIRAAT